MGGSANIPPVEGGSDHFRAAVDQFLDAVSIFRSVRDEDGDIVDFEWIYTNPAHKVSTGFDASDLIGRRLGEVLPALGPAGLLDRYKEVVDTGEPYVDPVVWYEDVWGDGRRERRAFDVRASKIADGLVILSRNITEERKLIELHAQLATIVEYSDDAIIGKTLDGIVTSWNRGAQYLYGYAPEEIVGRSIEILSPPDRPDEIKGLLERVRAGEITHHFDTQRRHKDGRILDVSVAVAPIHDDRGEVIGASVVGRDIGDRVRAEREISAANEALRRSDEVKNTFLRTVSHDVRSPLTAILSAARLLDGNIPLDDEERSKFAQMIVRNSNRIKNLLDDVLDVERLSTGELLEPLPEPVDVAELVHAIEPDLLNADDRTIEIETEVASIWADRTFLERILHNLLGNAVKHTPKAGVITVRTWRANDGTVLAVEDRGTGVPDEVKELIFEPFRRAADIHVPGSGIGLSLVASFARSHEGRAWVEDRPSGGSSFRVYFPDEKTSR